MFLLIAFSIGIILSTIYIYNTQYLGDGIIYWSIPLIVLIMAIFVVIVIILVLYVITWFIRPDRRLAKPRRFNQFITKIICELLLGLFGLDIVSSGMDKVPEDKKFLLVGNHQSNFDAFVSVWAFRKYSVAFIMKNNIMKVPLLGRWLYGAGFIPIDRKNNRNAVESIVVATKRIENNIQTIAVYPEGTRSKEPDMNEFRNGVFRIALKTKCPIVVSIIDNAYRVKHRFPFRRTKVYLEVVEVIEYENYKDLNTNQIGDLVHTIMEKRLNEVRKEIPYLKIK